MIMCNNSGVKQQANDLSCNDNKISKRKLSFKSIIEKYKSLIGNYIKTNYYCGKKNKCYLYIKNIKKSGKGPSSKIEIEFYSFIVTELSEGNSFVLGHNTFTYGCSRDAQNVLDSFNIISKDELKSKVNDAINKIEKWSNLCEMVD
jgi:hypothetical protein